MQGKDIRHLVAAVPSTVHFYNEPCGFDGAEVDYTHNLARGAHAANDPSFRWRYAACFSGARLTLPRLADGPIRNAYTFQICGYADDNLREAVAIHLNPSRLRQAFVQALLLLQELSMPEIAEAASLPLKALKYYEQLFFSVRDRMNDKAFIAGIVYPESRAVELQPDYLQTVAPCDLLLRAGLRGGLDAVLDLMGVLTERPRISEAERIRIMRVNILREAEFVMACGGLHSPKLPALDRAMKILLAKPAKTARPTEPTLPTYNNFTLGDSILQACRIPKDTQQTN